MPFMIGESPIRFTLKYLEAGRLIFKNRVKVFSINYNSQGDHHEGARQFVFWNLPQVQYKNPNIQICTFKNMTPSPFMRFFLENGEEILVDVDSKTKEEISDHLKKIICKTDEQLRAEAKADEKTENSANFGFGCKRHCICEIMGQVPCPAIVPLPKLMRGKYKYGYKEL